MVLVGITTTDTEDDIAKLSKKLLSLRVFEDLSEPPQTATKWYGKPWAKSIVDIQGEILSVSQFTLYGTVKKGTKPDFHRAAKGHHAAELYNKLLEQLRAGLGQEKVKDGEFGAMMDVVWSTMVPDHRLGHPGQFLVNKLAHHPKTKVQPVECILK